MILVFFLSSKKVGNALKRSVFPNTEAKKAVSLSTTCPRGLPNTTPTLHATRKVNPETHRKLGQTTHIFPRESSAASGTLPSQETRSEQTSDLCTGVGRGREEAAALIDTLISGRKALSANRLPVSVDPRPCNYFHSLQTLAACNPCFRFSSLTRQCNPIRNVPLLVPFTRGSPLDVGERRQSADNSDGMAAASPAAFNYGYLLGPSSSPTGSRTGFWGRHAIRKNANILAFSQTRTLSSGPRWLSLRVLAAFRDGKA